MDFSIPFDEREIKNQLTTQCKTLASRMAVDAAGAHFAAPKPATSWSNAIPAGRGYLMLQHMLAEKLDSDTTKATIAGIIEREFDAILLEATRKMMVKQANKAAWLAAQKNGHPKVASDRVTTHHDDEET